MKERPPLEAFTLDRKDDFPTLNPSKGLSATSSTNPVQQMSTSTTAVAPEAPEQEQSFLGKMKDRVVGTLKGVGETVLGNAKMVADEAPKLAAGSLNPLGRFVPSIGKIPAIQKGFDVAERALQPSNEMQAQAKEGEQWAEMLLPFITGGVALVSKLPKISRHLQEVSLHLTTAEKRNLKGRLEAATDFLATEGITGSPKARVDKIETIYDEAENTVQSFIAANKTKGVTVSRDEYIKELEGLKTKYQNNRDALAINNQIDEAVLTLKTQYAGSPKIPVDAFNEWKRTTFASAFNKAGQKVIDEVEFDVADKAKDLLEKSFKGQTINGVTWEDYNARYGSIINARKLLLGAENKDQISTFGKILSTMIGGGVGGTLGYSVGGPGVAAITGPAGAFAVQKIAPVIGGTAVKTNIAHLAESLSGLAPAARKSLGLLLAGAGAVTIDRLQEMLSGDESVPQTQKEPVEQAPQLPKEGRRPIESFKK